MSAMRLLPYSRSMARLTLKTTCLNVEKNPRQSTSPVPTGTSSPQVPGTLVRLPDPRSEDVQRLHRIALVIHDHVRRIEINADVRMIQLVQQSGEFRRGFLAGLQSEQNILH